MIPLVDTVAYFNGEFLPLDDIKISPLDRGFLFADGVYEAIPAYNGQLFRLTEHLHRLQYSLTEVALDSGLSLADWEGILNELVQRNGGGNLSVYLQITRGAPSSRDHGFPSSIPPTLFAMTNPLQPMADVTGQTGMASVTLADIRWHACHIKTTALLANVLARQQALQAGANDAILVRDGYLTEGSASNVFLVYGDMLLTPRKDWRILPGVTRDLILELASENAIPWREQDIPETLLADASEVWLTGSIREIMPITAVNGRVVGDGVPGPHWRRMMALYQDYKYKVCPPKVCATTTLPPRRCNP